MLKILIAEDELYARKLISEQIKKCDLNETYTVLEAKNGMQALEIYQDQSPDLVLTDIRMPVMDGLTLLQKIKELDPKANVVMMSAYSEFEYAQKAITDGARGYLLKPISDQALKQCLGKIISVSDEQTKKRMLIGQDIVTQYILKRIGREEYTNTMESSMFQRVFKHYQVLLIDFGMDERIPNIEDFLQQIEAEQDTAFWTRARAMTMRGHLWIFVTDPDYERVTFHRRIFHILSEKYSQISMGVSSVYEHAEDLYSAYQQAYKSVLYRFLTNERPFFAEHICPDKGNEWYLAKSQETMFEEAVSERNRVRAGLLLKSFFQDIKECFPVKTECLELFFGKLTLCFGQARGIPYKKNDILDFQTLDDMYQYFQNVCDGVCNKEDESDAVRIMVNYVQNHYDQELSVKWIAENVLFMNQNYLSHQFATVQGCSFSQYLRETRIFHAKRLLRSGAEYSITDIACMTGYSDTSQFIRAFRKETGMTPGKYQKKEQGGTDNNENDDDQ